MATENQQEILNGRADGLSLKDLIIKLVGIYLYLKSRWYVILVFGIIGAVLGLTYSILKKPIYTSNCTFVLEEGEKSNPLGNLGGLASIVGVEIGGGSGLFQGDNIIQLYKSRSMLKKTLLSEVVYNGKKQLLIDRYIDFNDLRDSWDQKPELKNIKFTSLSGSSFNRLQDSIISKVVENINKSNLSVKKPDKALSIISVEVKATDEFFAKAFNDQIVKNVNDFYVQTKTKKSLQNLTILQHQTDSVRRGLNRAIYETVAVADATPNLNPTRQILREPAQRSQFNAEANKIILGELVKNLELAKLSLRRETPLIQVIDNPVLPLTKTRVGKFVGILAGGLLFGFIGVFCLLVRKSFKQLFA